ncbi:MAG: hypothetical protein ACRC41_07980 [Sarcina sp.]
MTKEEFVKQVLIDQYEKKLKKRREFLYNAADLHLINSTKVCRNRVERRNRHGK